MSDQQSASYGSTGTSSSDEYESDEYSFSDGYDSSSSSTEYANDNHLKLYQSLESHQLALDIAAAKNGKKKHGKHHISSSLETADKADIKVATPFLLTANEQKKVSSSMASGITLPALTELNCEQWDKEDAALLKEYEEYGLSALDLTCGKCGGKMKKKDWRMSQDASDSASSLDGFFNKRGKARDQNRHSKPMLFKDQLTLECAKCGHCHLPPNKKQQQQREQAMLLSQLQLNSIVLPETQPLDKGFWSKVKKTAGKLSPRRKSKSSFSKKQQQQQSSDDSTSASSSSMSSSLSSESDYSDSSEEAARYGSEKMDLGHPYGGGRRRGYYYGPPPPYYYDPYYRRPHLWPFFANNPTEGSATASSPQTTATTMTTTASSSSTVTNANTPLDWHLFRRHRRDPYFHRDGTPRKRPLYEYQEEKRPTLDAAQRFVETHFAATPISSHPSASLSLSLATEKKPIAQYTVEEYEALLKGAVSSMNSLGTAINAVEKSVEASPSAVTPLDARRKKKGSKRHFYKGSRKGEWCVREPLPEQELNAPVNSSTTTSTTTSGAPILKLDQNTQLARLASQLCYADHAPDQNLRAMLMGEPITNLASPHSKAEVTLKHDIFQHLARKHTDFYNLLRDNDLLDMLKEQMDLVLIVPHQDALDTITNRVSEETASVLRYHCVIVPVAEPFKLVEQMTEYATLDGGNKVQVEKRGECFLINGRKLKSDVFYQTLIFHIQGILSPSQLVDTSTQEQDLPPPMDAPPELPPSIVNDDSTSSEASDGDGDGDGDGQSTNMSTTTTADGGDNDYAASSEGGGDDSSTVPEKMQVLLVPSAPLSLRGFDPQQTMLNKEIHTVATQMNRGYYSSMLDLRGLLDTSFTALAPAQLTLRTYNPEPLYRQYEARQLPDLARLHAETMPQTVQVNAQHQRRLDIGNQQALTEFALDSTSGTVPRIKKADLLAGITELSFPSPTEPGKVCTLHFRINEAASAKTDQAAYVSTDESVLLRFKGSALDTVAINTRAISMPRAAEPHLGHQFLELFTTEEQRAAMYKQNLSRDEFAQRLLLDAKLMRVLKKKANQAKRKVAKVGRRVINRGQREAKRGNALRVKAINLSQLPLDDLEAFEQGPGVTPVQTPVTVKLMDKTVQVVQQDSLEQLQVDKYFYKVKGETVTGYVFPEGSNALAMYLGQGKRGQYIEIRTGLVTVSFNFANMTLSPATQAYYAVRGSSLYVLQFDASSALKRLLIFAKSTKVVGGLQK